MSSSHTAKKASFDDDLLTVIIGEASGDLPGTSALTEATLSPPGSAGLYDQQGRLTPPTPALLPIPLPSSPSPSLPPSILPSPASPEPLFLPHSALADTIDPRALPTENEEQGTFPHVSSLVLRVRVHPRQQHAWDYEVHAEERPFVTVSDILDGLAGALFVPFVLPEGMLVHQEQREVAARCALRRQTEMPISRGRAADAEANASELYRVDLVERVKIAIGNPPVEGGKAVLLVRHADP
ncbi:hypothetical protein OF83DRAFT_625305 [Amylostereum chailletii]|nr:hypothetical protein OF83DRAFT_625305 [Amylostereum chailletii]